MQRAGRVAEQRTLEEAFIDADVRDADEVARVFARLRTAVEVACELEGRHMTADTQKRLAYLLQTLWFCGGRKREGSRAFIRTLAEKTGNRRRSLDRLLQRARELDLLQTWRVGRQTRRRLNERWIFELVAHRQGGAPPSESGAPPRKSAPKVAHHRRKVARRTTKLTCATPQSGAPIDNKVLNKKLNRGLPWPELVELLGGEGAAESLLGLMPEFYRDRLRRLRRAGEPIPEWLSDRFLEMAE